MRKGDRYCEYSSSFSFARPLAAAARLRLPPAELILHDRAAALWRLACPLFGDRH